MFPVLLPSGRQGTPTEAVGRITHQPPLAADVGRYAVGVLATGDPVTAGVTGGGGGGVIGAQVLAGGGPAGIWIALPADGSRRRMTPSPLLAPTEGTAT